jgi:hypothetical protein
MESLIVLAVRNLTDDDTKGWNFETGKYESIKDIHFNLSEYLNKLTNDQRIKVYGELFESTAPITTSVLKIRGKEITAEKTVTADVSDLLIALEKAVK